MDQKIHEELLFARTLTTDTKGESIFNVFKDYFMEKAIPLSNIISVASDGAPAMVGRYHCMNLFKNVINAVNRIRSNALNTRLFAQLCEENDENFH
ncbi:hypothetical protein NQ318_006343 [Aromia moschata]|uniref:DUF4371 domain-containing protein n=1 Tax=Aromia moschata TaxID=1265417 RepID=A0AAV8X3K4_9CUCU|nr:hypothetical protein NQ318_006343 [Aromia moschata]